MKKVFVEMLAMSVFINILALAVPIFTLQVYDRVIFSAGYSTLQGLVIGVGFILLFDYTIRQSRSRIMQTVALRVDVELGRRLFRKVTSLPLSHLEANSSGFWQALFRDVDLVRNTLSGQPAILLADLPFTIIFFAIIWVIAQPLIPVLVVIWALYLFIAWRSSTVMTAANREERATTQSRDQLIGELIGGRTTVKALGLDRVMGPLWEEAHADNIVRASARGSKTDSYANLGGSLAMATTIGLTTVGAVAIINQEMTMGSLIATNMLSGRLLGPLNQLVGTWRVYSSFRQAAGRLGEIFAAPSDRTEKQIEMSRPKGEIVLENVTFAYSEDGPKIIDGVKIGIRPGGLHAIVGRNGCGKTTLIKLIQGLYKPLDGRVMLDGADIAQFSRDELVNWIGYVPQETVLFQGTVRDNIALSFPGATDDQIIQAATEAGVHKFIIDLADGYGSEIGEAGRRLSGGQRQRIAIARALLGDPAVLLLDEPSGNLDRQAEEELRTTLVDLAKDHTVILITHSPVLLQGCDNLIALDKGRIALAGPAKEILPRLFGTRQKTVQPAAQKAPDEAPKSAAAAAAKPPEPTPPPAAPPIPTPPAAPADPTPSAAPPAAVPAAPAKPPARPPARVAPAAAAAPTARVKAEGTGKAPPLARFRPVIRPKSAAKPAAKSAAKPAAAANPKVPPGAAPSAE